MNTRKLLLILAAVFSCISVFIPFYSVRCEGYANGVPVEGTSWLSLIKTFSGIAVLISAVLIIVSVIFIKKKTGYLTTALINAACSVWGIFFMLNNPVDINASLETLRKLDTFYYTMKSVGILEAYNGPGFFFVLAAMIFVLVTMFLLYVGEGEK